MYLAGLALRVALEYASVFLFLSAMGLGLKGEDIPP